MTTTYLEDLRESLAYFEKMIREAKPLSDERESYKSMHAYYVESIKSEEEWIKNGGYSNKETHHRARFPSITDIITHANQRNRAGAQANSYWKRQLRKEARLSGRGELMAAIADWHAQLDEEAEESEYKEWLARQGRIRQRDYDDHVDDLWEEYLGQQPAPSSQPTRQETEAEAWSIYERCPLLRRKQKTGLSR